MKMLQNGIFIFFFTAICVHAIEYKKELDHVFDVEEGVTVVIKNGDGDVLLDTWEKDQVKVDVLYHSSSKYAGSEKNHEFDVEFSQKNNRVYIIGYEFKPVVNGFFSFQYLEYNYKITVPAYAHLEINGDDGDVEIKGVQGNIDCKIDDGTLRIEDISNETNKLITEDGDIIISNIQGDLSARCDDGDIFVENLNASETDLSVSDGRIKVMDSKSDFYVESDDGDISLIRIAGNEVDARSQDGDVYILFTGSGNVDISLNTDDGRVELTLDNPVSAAFMIETDDGHISFDSDNAHIYRDNDHVLKGELGDGTGRIRIQTRDGAVFLGSNF